MKRDIVLTEWWLGILTLVFSVVFLTMTINFPVLKADPGGTALLPRTAAAVTAVASTLLIARLVIQYLRTRMQVTPIQQEDSESPRLARRMVFIIIVSIVFPFAILELGLLLASILYTFVLMKIYRTKTHISITTSCATGIGVYVFFVVLIGAFAPPGRITGALLERLSG